MAPHDEAAAILRRVRDEVLTDEGRWTKGAEAHTAGGEPCHPAHDRAVRWCLTGALNKVHPRRQGVYAWHDAYAALCGAARDSSNYEVERFNDDPRTTFPDVRAVLDRAIELAGTGGA